MLGDVTITSAELLEIWDHFDKLKIDGFNRAYPVGTLVRYWPGTHETRSYKAITASLAYEQVTETTSGNATYITKKIVVKLQRPGQSKPMNFAYPITHVEAI